jgi:hypothetical protein
MAACGIVSPPSTILPENGTPFKTDRSARGCERRHTWCKLASIMSGQSAAAMSVRVKRVAARIS